MIFAREAWDRSPGFPVLVSRPGVSMPAPASGHLCSTFARPLGESIRAKWLLPRVWPGQTRPEPKQRAIPAVTRREEDSRRERDGQQGAHGLATQAPCQDEEEGPHIPRREFTPTPTAFSQLEGLVPLV